MLATRTKCQTLPIDFFSWARVHIDSRKINPQQLHECKPVSRNCIAKSHISSRVTPVFFANFAHVTAVSSPFY